MGRAIAGVVVGIVVWIVVVTVGNWLIRATLPGYTALEASMTFNERDGRDREAAQADGTQKGPNL